MLHRVQIDLAFPSKPDGSSLIAAAKAILNKAITINPGQLNQERGFIIFQECHHDENPPSECIMVQHYTTP